MHLNNTCLVGFDFLLGAIIYCYFLMLIVSFLPMVIERLYQKALRREAVRILTSWLLPAKLFTQTSTETGAYAYRHELTTRTSSLNCHVVPNAL